MIGYIIKIMESRHILILMAGATEGQSRGIVTSGYYHGVLVALWNQGVTNGNFDLWSRRVVDNGEARGE
jgi:dUTPase